jgi:hypothetical protein
MKTGKIAEITGKKDMIWLAIWFAVMLAAGVWNVLFLNRPALKLVAAGFVNTMVICFLVVIITLVFGWAATLSLHFLESRKKRWGYMILTFIFNMIRSVPQVVGILFGYILIASMVNRGTIKSSMVIFVCMACIMSIFIFVEVVDLMRERIDHFRRLDFYNAMRVCGIPEGRIINFDILWKNSRVHILNKLISVFGIAVFLQCSVDFIISVGLSVKVSAVTLPATLGSLLAKIDSKQDILAIGYTITHPRYFRELFLGHLQGVTVAFLIVFTLISIYNISNGFSERNRL